MLTHHRTILCLDRADRKIKHLSRQLLGQKEGSFLRVEMERDGASAFLVCKVDGVRSRLQVSADSAASVAEASDQATAFAVEEHHAPNGRPVLALRTAKGFLTAHAQGHCSIRTPVARAWEFFTVIRTATDVIAGLPDVLEYHGEFGAELVLFLPFCEWASRAGLLLNRELRVHAGMRCFYDHMACGRLTEKDESRSAFGTGSRPAYLPVRNEHVFGPEHLSPLMVYPNLRAKFARMPLGTERLDTGRKLLIVHNKSTNEWGHGPVNRIPLDVLERIFVTLSPEFEIVYIRHGMARKAEGYTDDVPSLDFADRELLDRFPHVAVFDDLHAEHLAQGGGYDVNTFKNVLYSRCFHFVTTQGGGAHHIAMFEGSVMAILHIRGQERRRAYSDGYYGLMARIPPLLLVAGSPAQLLEGSAAFRGSAVIGGQVRIASEHFETVERLQPRRG